MLCDATRGPCGADVSRFEANLEASGANTTKTFHAAGTWAAAAA